MISMKRRLTPVHRKPRMMKTIIKKPRTPKAKVENPPVVDKGWSNSHIDQSYT